MPFQRFLHRHLVVDGEEGGQAVRHQLQPVLAQGGVMAAMMTDLVESGAASGDRSPSRSCCRPMSTAPAARTANCRPAHRPGTAAPRRRERARSPERGSCCWSPRSRFSANCAALPSQSSSMRRQLWSWSPAIAAGPVIVTLQKLGRRLGHPRPSHRLPGRAARGHRLASNGNQLSLWPSCRAAVSRPAAPKNAVFAVIALPPRWYTSSLAKVF